MNAPLSLGSLGRGELAAAIRSGGVILHYQPKIDLATGEPVGAEALARWPHASLGMIPPSHFIPLAETCALIGDLTDAVVAIAARQIAEWERVGLRTNIAVNVSARNLDSLDFPDTIESICASHGCTPSALTIELTESAAQSVVHLLDTLTRLRIKQMGLSLDDFGTGYSSLVQLRQLPFTELKIDRSFVLEMIRSRDAHTIVKAIIDLGHNLGLKVVAEGVETAAALEELRLLGCDMAQGYFIAKPMPPADFLRWMDHPPSMI